MVSQVLLQWHGWFFRIWLPSFWSAKLMPSRAFSECGMSSKRGHTASITVTGNTTLSSRAWPWLNPPCWSLAVRWEFSLLAACSQILLEHVLDKKWRMTGSKHRFFGLQDLLATEACIYAMCMVCFKKSMFLGMKWILWIVTISRVIYRKMDLRCSYSWLSKWNDKAERMVLLVFSRERTSSPLEVSIAITRWTPGPSKSEIYDI